MGGALQAQRRGAVAQVAQAALLPYAAAVMAEASLQSYWRLGDAIGATSVHDSKGSVTGTPGGADGVFGTPGLIEGEPDTAFEITDGLSYIDFGANYGFAGTANFTVELILLPSNAIASKPVIGRHDGSAQGWMIVIDDNNGTLDFFRNGGALPQASNALKNDLRTHIAFTYDGTNKKCYVNGVLAGTQADGSSLTVPSGVNLRLGHIAAYALGLQGVYDEVAIYNTALSQSVLADHASKMGAPSQAAFDTAAAALSGIQHYWPMREASGTTWADLVGAKDLTVGADVSGFLTTGPDGSGKAPVGDGSATNRVGVSAAFVPPTPATYFWWARQDASDATDRLAWEWADAPTFAHYLNVNDTPSSGPANVSWNQGGAGGAQRTWTLRAVGGWDFYCLWVHPDGASDTGEQLRVFRNCAPYAGAGALQDFSGLGALPSMPFSVMGRWSGSARQLPYKGAAYGVGIVNRLITVAEMRTLRAKMRGPSYRDLVLGHPNIKTFFPLGESNNRCYDIGPAGLARSDGWNDGIFTWDGDGLLASGGGGSIGRATGAVGGLGAGDNYDFAGTLPFTIEFMVKFAGTADGRQIIGKALFNANGWWITRNSNNGVDFTRNDGSASDVCSSANGAATTTYHVACTYDGTNMRVYRNGALSGGPVASSRSLPGNALNFEMLDHDGAFGGQLSEVAVYDAALDAATVLAHYKKSISTRR